TDEFLVSVLKLSTFLELEDGIEHAVRQFERKGDDFGPALQFELARRYRVDKWIAPSFHRLMELSLAKMDFAIVSQLGDVGYFALVKTKAELEAHRKQFTYDTPEIQYHPNCRTRISCNIAWSYEWDKSVPKIIHHPDEDTYVSIANFLDNYHQTDVTDLCSNCRVRTIDWMLANGAARDERQIIDAAVAGLMAIQQGQEVESAARFWCVLHQISLKVSNPFGLLPFLVAT
ncbi:hypothetical protein R3P38DRAFT_2533480, partial [Favolaschia claudopus]